MSDVVSKAVEALNEKMGDDGFDGSIKVDIEGEGCIIIDENGARAGDEVRIEISGSNSLNYSRKHIVPRNMAILSRGAAWRRAGAAWPAGTYTGRVTLLRGGQSHSQKITTVEIAP